MLGASEALLYHDDLAPIRTPFYFHEFMEHATAHELQFLSEADLSDSQLRDVPPSVGELIESLPNDVIAREQYLDFFTNRMFRRTLLIHSKVDLRRAIDDRHVDGLVVSSPARPDGPEGRFVTPDGVEMSSTDPLVVAMMGDLSDRWPSSVSFEDLLVSAWRRISAEPLPAGVAEPVRGVLLEAYLAHIVELGAVKTPVAARASQRPLASPLARAQSASGHRVLSTLLPGNYAPETPLVHRALALLDGTRERETLARELEEAPEAIDEVLNQLAAQALLVGD
jgi:hypothetical protein